MPTRSLWRRLWKVVANFSVHDNDHLGCGSHIAGGRTPGRGIPPTKGGVGSRKRGTGATGGESPSEVAGRYAAIISGSASCFTTTPNHGSIISCDVSSPQLTSLLGSGLRALFAELS